MKTFTINASLLPKVTAKIENFRYKFAKYGNAELIYDVCNKRFISDKASKLYGQVVVDINIEASYKIEGYEFVASLEWDDKAQQNLIKKVSDDVYVPQEYRFKTDCDHCKVSRFRKYTIILKKDDEYIQVGKSCVKDYLGRDFSDYVSYLSSFDTLEEYIQTLNKEKLPREAIAFETDDVLLQTLEYVSRFGYISKKIALENDTTSTSSMIYYAMNKIQNNFGEILYKIYEISEDSVSKLKEVKNFLNNFSDESDYVNNLKIISNRDYIENKDLGLVVSIIGWYLRETAKGKKSETNRSSDYVGRVGEKICFTAVPTCITSYETQYGTTYIYKFEVGSGDVIIWRTQKSLEEVNMTLSGTVKAHNDFRGEKQTEVTRCKISK